MLIAPYGDITARLQRLRARGIAAVLVDRFSGDGRFSSVSVDSVMGGRMAVEHLIETGRRRIAFVGGPFDIRQVNDRLAGARVAAENASSPVEIEVIATQAMTVEEGAAAGARILARPRRDWPDALFAANDLLALGPSAVADRRRADAGARTRSRSSGSTTSRSPPRPPCRCRRCGSRAA